MASLEHEFIRITGENGRVYYGGNQSWFKQKYMRKAGCGVVAAVNTLLYVSGRRELSIEEFIKTAEKVRRTILTVPSLGASSLFVSIGLSISFRKLKIDKFAFWKILPVNFYGGITDMIDRGIPVILAIGRNFPMFGTKEKLKFYTVNNGKYEPETEANAHFVTITAINDKWLTVSSWGRRYYLNRDELTRYAWLKSTWLFTNVISVTR